MTLVTFNNDITPYCKGDTVRLNAEELEAVDTSVERRGLEDAYEVVKEDAVPAASELPIETEAPKKKGNKK